MNVNELEAELNRFFDSQAGPKTEVVKVWPSNGHAGLTYLFDIERNGKQQGYVLRLPPPGVRRHGNTDVYRQVPLLRSLHAECLPVPAVPWACADETWFGLPFLIMQRLPGRNCLVWDPDPSFERSAPAMHALWRQSAQTLAQFHRFDVQQHLADWEAPRALAEEISFWQSIYERAPQTDWAQAGARVQRLLLDTIPEDAPVGLVHGDYQPGNVMFDTQGKLAGVIDWELAHIGAQTLDLGWLMMMADPKMWHADYRAVHPLPVAELQAAYEQALGHPAARASWYQALSGYRLGAIACLNVKLHRKGQREDPLWEHIALSIPSLFGHAENILQQEVQ